MDKFGVPEAAHAVIDRIVTPLEQKLVAALADETFDLAEIGRVLSCPFSLAELSLMSLEGVATFDENEAKRFADSAYRRGIIAVAEEGARDGTGRRYRIADFYGRLDIFAVTEQDAWRSLPQEVQTALDDWYFDTYYAGLDWSADGGKPTDERVLTLEETLAYIDRNHEKGRQIYLTDCDCRALRGNCGSPTLVCLSYRDGPNSFPDRGISKPVTHGEAKAVVVSADRAALVHTVNPNGICNCCGDCCYLFRARKRRGSGPVWPESRHIITFETGRCIGCGICLGRCRFGVFDKSDFSGGKAVADDTRCVGCGVCVSTCPSDALRLAPRVGRSI
ncbi:MAG: 4Fe-4S binding protein [Clostridiales Family XIII bacterium]|nr:4Fe-4S binding protein [Clostridiales Family XIII bacterium]